MGWTYFVGVVVFLLLAGPVVNVIRMSSFKLLAGELTPIASSDMPVDRIDSLAAGGDFVRRLGFELRLHVKRGAILQGQPWGVFGDIYYHADNNAWALVYVFPAKHPIFSWKVIFITPTDRANLVTECSGELDAIIENFEMNSPLVYDPVKLWQSHLKFVADRSGYNSVELSEQQLLDAFEVTLFKGLILAGKVKRGNGFYTFPISVSFDFWRKTNRNLKELELQRKAYQKGPKNADLYFSSAASEYSAYQAFKKVQESNRSSWISKTGFLLASVVLFGISFGLINFSLQSLLILIAVLFIHEMGHLLGMWLFGYRDLRMLFVPFLGALAIGKKERVSALQEAVVLVLGPLPGYFIGVWILFSHADANTPRWVIEFGAMSAILNAINLLPFMPLDGGRIVNLALFNRLPYLQLGFAILSIIAFVSAGIFLHEYVWLVLAVLLFLGLPRLRVEITLMRHLLKEKFHNKPFSLEALLREIHDQKVWREFAVLKKWSLLDSLSYRIQHANAGFVTSVVIFSLWVATIATPPVLVFPPEAVDTLKAVVFNDYTPVSLEARLERYADADSDRERLERAFQIATAARRSDPDISRQYWETAKKLIYSDTLSEKDRAENLVKLSRMCDSFDGRKCDGPYLHAAIERYEALGGEEGQIIPLWIRLAENVAGDDRLAMEYLDKADRLSAGVKQNKVYFWKYDINTKKAEILSRQSKYDDAERLLLNVLEDTSDDWRQMLPLIQLRLLGLYALAGKYDTAGARYQDWVSRGKIEADEHTALSDNIHYAMAMMLADADPIEAGQLIAQVVVRQPVDKVEIEIARQVIGNPARQGGDDVAVRILAMSKDVSEAYEWVELGILLGEGLDHGRDDSLERVVKNRWYKKMRSFLDQPDYYELSQLIHRSYETVMKPMDGNEKPGQVLE